MKQYLLLYQSVLHTSRRRRAEILGHVTKSARKMPGAVEKCQERVQHGISGEGNPAQLFFFFFSAFILPFTSYAFTCLLTLFAFTLVAYSTLNRHV